MSFLVINNQHYEYWNRNVILHLSLISILLIANLLTVRAEQNDNQTSLQNLKCEYLISPNNVDTKRPHFSWVIKSNVRGQYQTAYQILVSTSDSNKGDMWNSGNISSISNSQIEYDGKPLKTNMKYFWTVKAWDKDSTLIPDKGSEFWTAILDSSYWKGKWIGVTNKEEYFPQSGFYQSLKEQYPLPDTVSHDGRSLLLRRTFRNSSKINNARIFVTGLGFYELFINGSKVGDHLLAPAKTNYREEVLYDTYDVTDIIVDGANALGIHLGNGWFNPYKKWWRPYRMQWFGAKRAYLQLQIEYEDGSSRIIVSDDDWKQAPGPVIFNCIYDGEIYDANKELDGWSDPNFDDSEWQNAKIVKSPGGRLTSHVMPAIKETQILTPIEVFNPAPDTLVYDMGQNFTGWVRIKFKGKKGNKLKLQFAEDIQEDGTIDITSNEHAKAQAIYILNGGSVEFYEPRFSYFGFKYVEITGEDELPEIIKVEGVVTHTDIKNSGSFVCGNETINKIHNATVWSQRSNIIGYPMDCPQRDERLGWFGDVQVTIEEALFNFDIPQFYRNWLNGIKLNQNKETGDIPIISPRPYIWDEGVEWSSTYIILVWKYYTHFGDRRILTEHYKSMKRYMGFLNSISNNYVLKQGWIGDWGSLVKGWKEGEPASVPTAFYYWNSILLNKIAKILGFDEDENYFLTLADQIKDTYNKEYFNFETKNYNDGSQMANAFPLYLGMVPESERKFVLENLVHDIVNNNEGHLTTGVLGSKYMIDALTKNGREDIAYLLATQIGYPSWSDMVEKYTTMCEFWTLKQSHNHVMTGSIDAFFYKTLAGININEKYPGCKYLLIKPYIPKNLNFVSASFETINGIIESSWEKFSSGLKMTIKIPPNVSAQIHIPASDPNNIYESGIPAEKSEGIQLIESSENTSKFLIGSGSYEFTVAN